jgi:putative FmdB family regulatory protein
MPIFEYICKECDHRFEALVYGKEKAECPKCRTTRLKPQLGVRSLCERRFLFGLFQRRLRIMRRSPRPRRLLDGQELGSHLDLCFFPRSTLSKL